MKLRKIIPILLVIFGMGWLGNANAQQGVKVVYPSWFKESFYDLPLDLRDAKAAGKKGIMLFFSTPTCSYCHAMLNTTFKQDDIVKRLRKDFDVIGINVLSDTEVVDPNGKSQWAKDFAVEVKAKFTPTMVFYATDGQMILRLVGYQPASKFHQVLNYLEGDYASKISLREYIQRSSGTEQEDAVRQHSSSMSLDLSKKLDKPLLVIFDSNNCANCRKLNKMLSSAKLAAYTKKLNIVHVNSNDKKINIKTPEGQNTNAKAWANRLNLTHSPAMVFYTENGDEVLRIDSDILINAQGRAVKVNDDHALSNIKDRLEYVLDKGYLEMPQFQRWIEEKSRTIH